MSTNCAIEIKDEAGPVFFYRHWDGYLEVAGVNLLLATDISANAGQLCAALLSTRYGDGRAVYEPLPSFEDIPDSIEFFYSADPANGMLRCAIRNQDEAPGERSMEWTRRGEDMDLAGFKELLNAKIHEENRKIRESKAANPNRDGPDEFRLAKIGAAQLDCIGRPLGPGAAELVDGFPEALPDGSLPLHVAARLGAAEHCELLCRHGADPLAKDAGGMSALDIARERSRREAEGIRKGSLNSAKGAKTLARLEAACLEQLPPVPAKNIDPGDLL